MGRHDAGERHQRSLAAEERHSGGKTPARLGPELRRRGEPERYRR